MNGPQETGSAPRGALSRVAAAVGMTFGAVSALIILFILVLTAANVVGRYLLSAPIRGAEEATGFLVVAIVMAGAAEAYRRDDHIRIDLVSSHFGAPWGRVVEMAGDVVVIALGVLLAQNGWHTVSFSRMFGAYSSGYLQIPMWIPQSALVFGGVLLAVMASLKLLIRAGLGR